MGRLERATLTVWAWVLEGVAAAGDALGWRGLTDAASSLWAPVMDRMDKGLNGR